MLRDKIKDSKTKQKLDLIKSAQNLVYLIEPLNHDGMQIIRQVIQNNGIETLQTLYQKQYDEKSNRYFLKTKHNQLRKDNLYFPHYRSPYSNIYHPEMSQKEGVYPSPLVRNIEEKGLLLFAEYSKMYYGKQNCISNFFVEENEEDFYFAYYVQKHYTDQNEGFEGIWNSTNVAEIKGDPSKNIAYKVTTSVIYELKHKDPEGIQSKISGNIKRIKNQNKKPTLDSEIDQFHLMMIGKMVEENESFLRQQIQSVYIRKIADIIHKTRVAESNKILDERQKFNKNLFENKSVPKKQID